MIKHVEMVFKEQGFHACQLVQGSPLHLHGVVVCLHLGQRGVAQVEVVRMGDGAAALAAVRVIKHGY